MDNTLHFVLGNRDGSHEVTWHKDVCTHPTEKFGALSEHGESHVFLGIRVGVELVRVAEIFSQVLALPVVEHARRVACGWCRRV